MKKNTALKLTQLSSDLQKTNAALKRVVSKLDITSAKIDRDSEQLEERSLAAPTAKPEHEQVPPKRKRFWSKLNPFSKNKAATPQSSP